MDVFAFAWRPAARMRKALALARSGDARALIPLLTDPIAGVRRLAARGIGRFRLIEAIAALEKALEEERTETVRLAIGAALIRCGADRASIARVLCRQAEVTLETAFGPRCPGVACGHNRVDLERQLQIELDPTVFLGGLSEDQIVANATERGRRPDPRTIEALGWFGDPAYLAIVARVLRAVEDDPARGFRNRAAAATALGRIGNPAAFRVLRSAMEREAAEFEGRPGAGLGVQIPVREHLLWAFGEIGHPVAIGLLVSYLTDISGTPTGGLYLPAMGALVKFGVRAVRPLEKARSGPEILARNAEGVLAVLRPDLARQPSGGR